jgi:hypothetical protein
MRYKVETASAMVAVFVVGAVLAHALMEVYGALGYVVALVSVLFIGNRTGALLVDREIVRRRRRDAEHFEAMARRYEREFSA